VFFSLFAVSVGSLSEREWATTVLSDWATNGQCTIGPDVAKGYGPGLAGNCGAQAFVLDLTQEPARDAPWFLDGIAGHVEFYQMTAGKAGEDASMFPFGPHSMYELGSTTKAYTTVLTQLLVDGGFLSWEDPISKFFPDVHFIDPAIASVTLHLISTHSSGLPPRPWNLPSERPAYEPYANFTEAELLRFLNFLQYGHGDTTPKGEFIYCNDGFGLLGVILERTMKKSYEDLLVEYILDPLGLNETSVNRLTERWVHSGLVPLNQSQMSPGHDKYTGKVRIRRQPYGIFKANGALKSTGRDMLHWMQAALLAYHPPNETETVKQLRANRTQQQEAISQAIKEATEPEKEDCPTPPLAYAKLTTKGHVGRAWQNYWSRLTRTVWKSGNTRGFGTFKAYDWARGRAVWGYDTCGGCDDNKLDKTAMMLLEGPPAQRTPIQPSKEQLQKFVGTYYFNSCNEQDVDMSHFHRHCQDCHEQQVSLADGFEVSLSSYDWPNVLMVKRTHWEKAVPLNAFDFKTVAWAEKYPAPVESIAFRLTTPDRAGWINAEHRNKGRTPFLAIDNRLGAQEIYFILNSTAPMLVFHSGGIDSFAVTNRSMLSSVVCGVGHGLWNGMCS